MKSKLSEDLWTHFPWTRPDPEDQMSPWTLFGFECGDGWHQLLSDKFFEIEEQYLFEGREVDLKIGQIKEKFGTLHKNVNEKGVNFIVGNVSVLDTFGAVQ